VPTHPHSVAPDGTGASSAARAEPTGIAWVPLEEYGLIGNEVTGALVSKHGSIDWACLPRFDSPSVFARLLDRTRGGYHSVRPIGPYQSHQQYVTGTNVLVTFFELKPRVTLTVTDFMPMGPPATEIGGDPRIVRQLRARGAPVEIRLEADPRFDYGNRSPEWTIEGPVARARSGEDELSFVSPWAWHAEDGVAISGGVVEPNRTQFSQVRWGAPPPPEPAPTTLLSVTDSYWRGWVAHPEAPMRRVAARWHPWVERSELVLKLLSYGESGVFVAAPTTSLPEWVGGRRNWDYRYVWIRDAAFTAQVFLLLGHVREARSYVSWAFDRAAETEADLRTVFAVDGRPAPDEVELPHLEGYRGSRPVRVGNSAVHQRQLDMYGELLDAALMLERSDPAFVLERWSAIEWLADRAAGRWMEPDQGIWEVRAPPAHYVHSKLLCWVALDRAIQLARAFGKIERANGWSVVAERIRAAILERGFDAGLGSFVQAFGSRKVDASGLRIALDGLLPPEDPRVLGTIAAVERMLARGPFVRRYEGEDGLEGPEGVFLLCSFWLVESLARSGQMGRALENWRALLDVASPLLLFSEQYDPSARELLGNFPQAFTHIGLLRAALALGLMAPEG
jgi:GH15 family glucan-1,4-alpha-glucosidase